MPATAAEYVIRKEKSPMCLTETKTLELATFLDARRITIKCLVAFCVQYTEAPILHYANTARRIYLSLFLFVIYYIYITKWDNILHADL